VRGIPTLILFKDGQIKGQMVGVNPKSDIVSLVQKNL
jgi:thioredoxin-like negative regulator of GroEL